MSMFAKALFDNLHLGDKSITRVDSPKIVQETKSKDFDTTSVRSPVGLRRNTAGKKIQGRTESSELSPVATERAFNARYLIENEHFARGAYGKVELAFDKMDKEKVAIKRIPKTTPIKMVQAEVRAGQLVGSHPNIAKFHKYCDFGDLHTLVFQFIDGKDLFTHLEETSFTPKPEAVAKSIISDVVRALSHTHSKNIAHRDIKLENILLDKTGKAYLIDYGLCAFTDDGKKSREWCGSDNYLAPQIVRREAYDGKSADIFSLGVVAFAVVFGVFPFENLRVNSRYSNDPSKPLPTLRVRFPTDVRASLEVKDLLIGMLEDDPEKRITMEEIIKHEWICGSTDPILSKESSE